MGTRGWTLSTFVGCCIWILHGLRAATAVPVTTEEPFATGTASPVGLETEGPYSQVLGTAETNTVTANAETTEIILAGSPASPSFPPGAEPGTLVPGGSDYGSTAPTSTNVTKHLNASQGNEEAVTAAAISAQHPAVTPEVALGVTEATPGARLGTTPLFTDVKEDVLAAVTREGTQDLDPAAGAVPVSTTPPPAATWVVQPTADSPVGAGVTALQNQGLTTATGAAEEGRTLPVDIQNEVSANSLSHNPGAGVLLTTQQDGAMSETMGITPEPVGETASEAKESALASVPGDAEDAVNDEPSTADSSHLPPESVTMSGTVENPGEPSLLPSQAALGLAGSGDRDGDGQGGPGKSLDTLGSTPVLAGSEAPAVTGDTATLLLGPRIPTDAHGDINSPALATGEQPPPLAADLSSSTDSSSAPGTAYPPLGAGAGTGPSADDGTETPVSPDVGASPGALMSPSLRGSQPWGTAAGTPQGADEPGAGSNSALGDSNPTSSIPDGLPWPTAGVSAQGGEGTGNMAQAGGPGDGSPFEDTQSDMDPSGLNTQQDPANTGELPAGGTGALTNDELSPPSALGHGTGSGAASALEPVSLPGSAPPGNAGLESDLSGAEGPGDLPSESSSAPGAVAGPGAVAEPPESPNLGAAQGAPVPPILEGSQPWGTAGGAPQGAGLPGANGPDTGLTSEWDAPSSVSSGLAGPPSPALGDQVGTNLGLQGEEGLEAGTTEQVLGGAGRETGFESSLGSAAGNGTAAGMDQLPGAGSLSSHASPGGAVTASSTSRGDEAGPIPATTPGSDGLSLSSPGSETSPDLTPVQETESTGDVAQAGNPESESPHTETSLSGLNTQQDPANTGELPAGGTGALANDELSPPSALGHGTEAGAGLALGPESPPGSAPPGNAGLESDLTGAEGHGDMPGESPSAPGAAYPPSGAVASPVSVAEAPESPSLGAAQGAPVPPSLEGSQPWGTAGGAPQGAGLPGANGPDTDLTSEWGVPVSTSSGLAGPPSPALGDQLSTNLGLPAAEGHGAGTTDLGEAGSETGFESSLGTAAGSRTAGGMDQLPGAGSLSGPASLGSAVAAPSGLDPASPSALGGAGSVPGGPQPSLDAGPGIPPATGEGAGEVAGNGVSLGQSQITAEGEPAGSGAADGEMGAVLQSASSSASVEELSSPVSSSTSMERSSSPGTAGEADNGASLPGAGGSLSTGLEAAGPREPPMSASGIQSGADLGLPDAKLSKVNVVELPEGASVNGASSPDASLGESTGVITQIASGSLTLSGPASPQGTQPLVLVASDGSGVSDDTATSLAAPLLPGHGLSSGLAPSGDTHSSPGTQSGSRPLLPGARAGLAGDIGGAQTWSLEDEVASGMPAPSEEVSPRASASPAAEEPSATPGLPAQLSGLPAVRLYSYGVRENDQEYVERRVDFSSPLFKPETGFPFGKTLRDSLYFTDNGQIIFPSSDNTIFTYPNPPSRGFNGHEEVPMIAVFWDNADFSRGVGTTYYQEFLTLNTEKPPFIRDVEAKIRRYLRSSYSAAWTLKITWEKAPAYGARTDIQRTSTYQAVLTTDGFRSYVLMLYQDGGMGWDYTRLAATNVLIGYTSGDGSYRNDDLTQRPPSAKYRPDQFRGYNTDLRGLWIYKLESRVGVNYRLKCLAWTGRQQEPQMWSQGLPSCPCSLQQGQQDPRFKSSRRGWWAARISMLHSATPNQHGAGVRCLYDSQSQLIEGRQERYWRSSRQASPYRDQELKLYDWCCNQAGSAHLCARYSEKRPKIGCDGYQSPGTVGSSEESESDSEEQRGEEDE